MREDHDRSERSTVEADVEVMGAYDDVDGIPAYVIAALDSDEAWIAVPDGAALDVSEWC